MRILHDLRLRRLLAAFAGKERIREIWHGKHRLWPDDSLRANGLRVKLPEVGTEEWAYWVHAVDAVQRLGASADCYLRLVINGKHYYLIDSPDGSEALKLDGGMAYFEGGKDFPADGLGLSVTAEGVVPKRNELSDGATTESGLRSMSELQDRKASFKGQSLGYDGEWMFWMSVESKQYDKVETGEDDEFFSGVWKDPAFSAWNVMLPVIKDTELVFALGKGGKEENVRGKFEFFVLPEKGAEVRLGAWQYFAVGGGRRTYTARYKLGDASDNEWTKGTSNMYTPGGWGFRVEMWHQNVQYGGYGFGAQVVWPAFTRSWQLPVVNVNVAE